MSHSFTLRIDSDLSVGIFVGAFRAAASNVGLNCSRLNMRSEIAHSEIPTMDQIGGSSADNAAEVVT